MADEETQWFADAFGSLVANVEQVIKGKRDEIALAVVCMAAEGHLLLEDVPGTGKTVLAKSLANSIQGTWRRVQFTPDLLPSDVTGVMVYNQSTHDFVFHEGPVFSNVVLADEINRASPKTQSALLEVMEEQQVTIEGAARFVPRPFVVIATQNPIEQEGTYRLPEAQLDRFLMRSRLGYPDTEAEIDVLRSRSAGVTPQDLQAVLTIEQVQRMIDIAASVHVEDSVRRFIVQLAQASRALDEVRLGVSTRGCLALMKAGCALAASQARSFVTPDDVIAVAQPVLAHRLLLTPQAELKRVSVDDLIERILADVSPPAPSRSA